MASHHANSLMRGMRLPFRGAGLLWRLPQVKRVAILPVAATFLLYLLVVGLAFWWLWNWDWNLGEAPWQFWGGFGAWLHGVLDQSLDVLKWIVALPFLLVACYFTFTSAGMILASPFNDMLSERIELAVCEEQHRPELTWSEQGRIIATSVLDSLAIVIRQLGWMLLALPFLLIPYFGFLPLFLVTAYHTGLGFVDVAMARNHLRHRHKKVLIQGQRRTLMGIGLAMELMFMVPGLGLLILPLGVVAGTLLYCGFNWEDQLRHAQLPQPPKFVPPKLRVRIGGPGNGGGTSGRSE